MANRKLRAGISLCMIVRNEERFLADALRSVAGAVDEICIADTGSTDGTLEIARAFGARVVEIAWNDDFARARNASLALATRRWIFVLDADERLDPAARPMLRVVASLAAQRRGLWVNCRNLTAAADGAGAMTNALVRIFPNDARIRYRNAIHEFVALDGSDAGLPADRSPIAIVHHGYLPAIVAERAKGGRNLRLSRVAAEREPHDPFHHYNLGMASVLAGEPAAAIVALERMRDLTRNSPRGYRVHGLVALADLYADVRGDLAAAHACVRDALTCVPTYSNAHYVEGKLLARERRFYEAREAFGRAIAAGVHDDEQFVVDNEIAIWKAPCEIGSTLMNERRYADALAWFELAARARPGARALLVNRAKCLEELGDVAAAERLFEAAFTAHRDEPTSTEWVNFLLRCGRADDALLAIDAALGSLDAAGRTIFLAMAAAVHTRAGRPREADGALRRAREASPESGALLAALAVASR